MVEKLTMSELKEGIIEDCDFFLENKTGTSTQEELALVARLRAKIQIELRDY